MTLAKLQRPISFLAYGPVKLSGPSEATLAEIGVNTVGDFLWRFGDQRLVAKPDVEETQEPDVVAILVAAARLYLVKAMPADLAVALALHGVQAPTDLADFDLDDLVELVGDFSLEHPPSPSFLAGLQVEAARAEDKGHVWGRIAPEELPEGEDVETGDPYAWSGSRRADMSPDGSFALMNLTSGETVVRARARGYLEVSAPMEVRGQRLSSPLVLRLPADTLSQDPELEARERVGGPLFGVEVGREIQVELADLPDDTYLSLRDDGALVHLLRLRRGLEVMTEIVPAPAGVPGRASPGDILHYKSGKLVRTELDHGTFARLKAGLPEGLWG